jgi:hypothetical protein
VDLTYRTELRQLNDLNYSRFEAKLEQSVTRREFEERVGLAFTISRFVRP